MKKKFKSFLAIVLLLASLETADASIININSRSNNESTPVSILLSAGTYDVTPIGTSDGGAYNAWNAWNGQVTGCDGNGANCTSGWLHWYYIISDEFAEKQLWDNVIYANASLALANAAGTSFTLSSDANVNFYIRDGVNGSTAWDNAGGISLNVNTVPVPAAFWLLGSCLVALVGLRKKLRLIE